MRKSKKDSKSNKANKRQSVEQMKYEIANEFDDCPGSSKSNNRNKSNNRRSKQNRKSRLDDQDNRR
ncbi:MAG: hypothetical protein IJH18_04305 [Bacilli bacterium]|nr:hypothetical protein [Bacilli bacterium]